MLVTYLLKRSASARFVGGGGGGGNPSSGASQPSQVFIDPPTGLVKNSQKYVFDPSPLWFYHKSSTAFAKESQVCDKWLNK